MWPRTLRKCQQEDLQMAIYKMITLFLYFVNFFLRFQSKTLMLGVSRVWKTCIPLET